MGTRLSRGHAHQKIVRDYATRSGEMLDWMAGRIPAEYVEITCLDGAESANTRDPARYNASSTDFAAIVDVVVPLGRPGRIFRLSLQNKRSRPDPQAAEGGDQAEYLQDCPDKIQQHTIHRGHSLFPLSRIRKWM